MNRPLEGRRVVVTRPEGEASELAAQLAELGAIPVLMPAVEIVPLQDTRELDACLLNLGAFDWIVLTSVNGVAAVQSRMEALQIPTDALGERKLAVIGPATAQALTDFCRPPDLVPDEFVSEGISEALQDVAGQRFLLARADLARKDLALNLRGRGAQVTEVAAYHIRPASSPPEQTRPDFIALTSSAGAGATLDRYEQAGRSQWLREAELVCIGPITADTVRSRGYSVAAIANPYTSAGLLQAIVELATKEPAHA